MASQLLDGFFGSSQYGKALEVLKQKGIDTSTAKQVLERAVPASGEAMDRQTEGQQKPHLGWFNLFGGHSGWEFLTGATEGLFKGQGMKGSLEDGGMSLIAGHVAECVADRTGMSRAVAGEVAAAATPFIVHYVQEKLRQHKDVVQEHGEPPKYQENIGYSKQGPEQYSQDVVHEQGGDPPYQGDVGYSKPQRLERYSEEYGERPQYQGDAGYSKQRHHERYGEEKGESSSESQEDTGYHKHRPERYSEERTDRPEYQQGVGEGIGWRKHHEREHYGED